MRRILHSKWVYIAILLSIFSLLLFLNSHSLMLCDDFTYAYSFADGERITGILEIFPSMAAHAKTMNGRVLSHFLVQLFLMLPPAVFDIANAAVFTLQIILIYKIALYKSDANNLLLVTIFSAVWIFQLEFGQSNLWLDGACNYLWNVVVSLLFIWPFVQNFMQDGKMPHHWLWNLFPVFGFVAGAYGECGSAACIGIAGLLYLFCIFYQHKKIEWVYAAAILISCAGYIFMITQPASRAHIDTTGHKNLGIMVLCCRAVLQKFRVLTVGFLLLFLMNLAIHTERKRMILASVFFIAAVGADFIMVFAPYYPLRVSIHTVIYLILADAVLFAEVIKGGKYKWLAVASALAFLLILPVFLFRGTGAVQDTYVRMQENKRYIQQCIQQGQRDIVVPDILPSSHYSEAHNIFYLSRSKTQHWPNAAIERYYGLDSITSDQVSDS